MQRLLIILMFSKEVYFLPSQILNSSHSLLSKTITVSVIMQGAYNPDNQDRRHVVRVATSFRWNATRIISWSTDIYYAYQRTGGS